MYGDRQAAAGPDGKPNPAANDLSTLEIGTDLDDRPALVGRSITGGVLIVDFIGVGIVRGSQSEKHAAVPRVECHANGIQPVRQRAPTFGDDARIVGPIVAIAIDD